MEQISKKETQRLFCNELYEFQTERMTELIGRMLQALGPSVMDTIHGIPADWREPLRVYMKTTVKVLEALQAAYGDAVLDIIKEFSASEALKRGQQRAAERGTSLDAYIEAFGKKYLVSQSETEVVLRREGCLVSQVAKELGVEKLMYWLHCYGDHYLAEGMNPGITLRHVQTCMEGCDCCEYVLTLNNV